MECEGYAHYAKSGLDTCRPVEDKMVWRFFPAFFINDNVDTFYRHNAGCSIYSGGTVKG